MSKMHSFTLQIYKNCQALGTLRPKHPLALFW